MPVRRALIVEDDADINEIVATKLTRSGFTCTQAFSGSEARLLVGGGAGAGSNAGGAGDDPLPYDVVISDLMLPGLSGEDLVRLIRARDATVPVIIASARTGAADKVDLLKLGADDYLAKPFDLDELVARVEVQLRHRARTAGADGDGSGRGPMQTGGAEGAGSGTLRYRSWTLDPAARAFTVDGAAVELTRLEFGILEALMEAPARVFSKQALFERAWGVPYAADDNTVNVHVSNIRAKLRASGTDGYLKTVWGMGFKLD